MECRSGATSDASSSAAPSAKLLFHPRWCIGAAKGIGSFTWTAIVEAPAPYTLDDWLATMRAWIAHPERNSSNIRRAEIWAEETLDDSIDARLSCTPSLVYRCLRRLLPRRTLDHGMLQECAIYVGQRSSVIYTTLRTSNQAEEAPNSSLLSTRTLADAPRADTVPYYFPTVRAVAFHYEASDHSLGTVRIDYALFDDTIPTPDSRLGRTALSLLRLMHQHSYGHANAYVKRVEHDMLVPRDTYQDLYLILRTRHAGSLIRNWAEVTDPAKHVFEDIGIAAYLILLWRDMFPSCSDQDPLRGDVRCGDAWGAPPGGFIDVGCGNGLLTHLLTIEVCSINPN